MKTLFVDGHIYPMNNSDECFKYLGIENNKIIYIGNDYPKIKFNKVVSLKDKYVYPTLTDSHMHLLYSIVLASNSFNICNITTKGIEPDNLNDIEIKIKEYVNNHPKNKLIVVNQYISPAIKEKRLPTCKELDKWTNNKEVIVFSIDGHSASLSSSLLTKLNISSNDGIITGEEYDMNQGMINNYIASKVSLKDILNGIVNFTNECYKYGIGKVCALDGEDNGNNKDSLLSLITFFARRLDIDVRLFFQYHNYKVLDKYKNKIKDKRIGGCSKWELDGSVGSHSASFYYPYKDSNSISNLYYKEDYVSNKLKEALENHYMFTCHAIGTKAIDEIVNAYKENENLLYKDGYYCRIDHFEFPSNEAIEFVSKHRIAITFQPGYSYIDKHYIHSYVNHLNQDNLNYLAKLKELVNKNILVLGSSDCPVQSINPFDQMYGMVNYYLEDESISNYEALKTYTTNPSIALNEKEGRLDINSDASFIISDYDIINMDKKLINQITINSMFLHGKKVKKLKLNLAFIFKLLFRKPKKI